MNIKLLSEPFNQSDIEWRIQSCGENNGKIWARALAYVTNRAIQQRFDDVIGPENWKNDFKESPCGGLLCGISVRCGDEWVTKWDGAENTDIEGVKGGLSGAMKRAAVQWGTGRYLYALESNFAVIDQNGKFKGKTKEGKFFKWNPPQLPEWALPKFPDNNQDEGKSVLLPSIKAMHQAIQTEDCMLMRETWDELNEDERKLVWMEFKTKDKTIMKGLLHESTKGENNE